LAAGDKGGLALVFLVQSATLYFLLELVQAGQANIFVALANIGANNLAGFAAGFSRTATVFDWKNRFYK